LFHEEQLRVINATGCDGCHPVTELLGLVNGQARGLPRPLAKVVAYLTRHNEPVIALGELEPGVEFKRGQARRSY
jgi:hypothetical protein